MRTVPDRETLLRNELAQISAVQRQAYRFSLWWISTDGRHTHDSFSNHAGFGPLPSAAVRISSRRGSVVVPGAVDAARRAILSVRRHTYIAPLSCAFGSSGAPLLPRKALSTSILRLNLSQMVPCRPHQKIGYSQLSRTTVIVPAPTEHWVGRAQPLPTGFQARLAVRHQSGRLPHQQTAPFHQLDVLSKLFFMCCHSGSPCFFGRDKWRPLCE